MKKVNIYILAKELYTGRKDKFEITRILDTYFVRKVIKPETKKHILKMYKSEHKVAIKMEEIYKKEVEKEIKRVRPIARLLELVTLVKSKWAYGEYEAHEYDQFVRGRVRRHKYSNGYIEYEIECLDKTLSVADGMSDDYQGNGCGDNFELMEKRTW